jgi:Uma2 family endonuclease
LVSRPSIYVERTGFSSDSGAARDPDSGVAHALPRRRRRRLALWSHRPADPHRPPFRVVEILSPEDRLVRLQPKIREYLAHGVEWVWIIDPDERALSSSPADPEGALVDELRTLNPDIISILLADVLSALD